MTCPFSLTVGVSNSISFIDSACSNFSPHPTFLTPPPQAFSQIFSQRSFHGRVTFLDETDYQMSCSDDIFLIRATSRADHIQCFLVELISVYPQYNFIAPDGEDIQTAAFCFHQQVRSFAI